VFTVSLILFLRGECIPTTVQFLFFCSRGCRVSTRLPVSQPLFLRQRLQQAGASPPKKDLSCVAPLLFSLRCWPLSVPPSYRIFFWPRWFFSTILQHKPYGCLRCASLRKALSLIFLAPIPVPLPGTKKATASLRPGSEYNTIMCVDIFSSLLGGLEDVRSSSTVPATAFLLPQPFSLCPFRTSSALLKDEHAHAFPS